MFSELREEILSDSDFSEQSAYRENSESANGTPLMVRFDRQDPGPMSTGERESIEMHRGVVKCMSTVHATLGGVVSPKAGDEFKLAKVKGGVAVWGWKVESVRGGLGGWELTVMYRERREAGGKRMERGQ